MVLRLHILFILFISSLSSYTLLDDLVPITFNDQEISKPFLGGFNRPKIQWVDWDFDQDIDLFVLDASGYLRFIENQGNQFEPVFKLKSVAFQSLMCGGWFFFNDFDNDGEIDLMVQDIDNPNLVSFYKNYDSSLIYLGNLVTSGGQYVSSSSVMTPTFADIDNDGDYDFFTGNMVGTLTFYENIGLFEGLPQFEYITNAWQDISIIGTMQRDERHGASAITFIDLNGDDVLDLSWGDYFQQSLYIIWNSGTAQNPVMDQVTSQYPPADPIISAGQNMPTFADLDGDGDEDLFITVLSGAYGNQLINNFYYYKNIGTQANPEFEYITNNYFSMLDIFSNNSPEFVDIDNDNDYDLFIANQYDLSESPWVGKIFFFRNIGNSSNPQFIEEETSLANDNLGQMLSPEFGDLNNDGYKDLIVGDFNGYIQYFQNNGDEYPISFTFVEKISDIDLSGNSVPSLGDLDNDGDLDLLIGQLNGELVFYKNFGSINSYNFQLESFQNIEVGNNSAPELIDKDGDGDLDLFLGSGSEGIYYYWNDSRINYSFQMSSDVQIPFSGVNTKPAVGNLFDSELVDIFSGISTGGMYHFQMKTCFELGDLNGDFVFNVLDVVQLSNCVLFASCFSIENGCAGDVNLDGSYNVLDVVSLINCILSQNC